MTYTANSKITASDYNSLITDVNKIYSTGFSNTGLGQTALTPIAQGSTVDNSEWDRLGDTITSVAAHQGTSITAIPSINEGDVVKYLTSITNGKTAITNKYWNAAAQGTTASSTTTYSSTWKNSLTFTHTITFQSGDAARYFFNAGGQIALSFAKTGTASIDVIWKNLITKMGTLVLSAGAVTGSPTSTVAGTTYSGFTQVSTSANKGLGRLIYKTDYGYYRLSTSNVVLFEQNAQTSAIATGYGYGVSYIRVSARTNGARGIYGDNGSTITLTTLWDEVPNGLDATAGTSMTVTVRPPSTSHISSSWGSISVTGVVTGS